jgi:hypothetical protein
MGHDPSKSPIRTIPNELLLKIFDIAERSTHRLGQSRENGTLDVPPPLDICSLVCKDWHDICHGSPSLWSTIRLNLDQTWCADLARWATARISRSQQCVIDLHVTGYKNAYGQESQATSDNMPSLYQLLDDIFHNRELVPRLRSVVIELFCDPSIARKIESTLGTRAEDNPETQTLFPSFKSLLRFEVCSIYTSVPPTPITLLQNALVSIQAPQLRHLRLYNFHVYPLLPKTLRSLDLFFFQPSLESLCALRELDSLERIVLRRSTPLSEEVISDVEMSQPAFKLSFPSLRFIALSQGGSRRRIQTGMAGKEHLSAYIQASRLSVVELSGFYPDHWEFFRESSMLPNVHTLRLTDFFLCPASSTQSLQSFKFKFNMERLYHVIPNIETLHLIDTKGALVIALDTMCLPFAYDGRNKFIDTRISPSQTHLYDDSASGINIHIKERRGFGKPQLGVELPHRLEGQTNESKNGPPSIWPKLRTISVSSIDEEDIVWICMLVASRARCEKEHRIQNVNLSAPAMRHLSSSVYVLPSDWRTRNAVKISAIRSSAFNRRGLLDLERDGEREVKEWLEGYVKVRSWTRNDDEDEGFVMW